MIGQICGMCCWGVAQQRCPGRSESRIGPTGRGMPEARLSRSEYALVLDGGSVAVGRRICIDWDVARGWA